MNYDTITVAIAAAAAVVVVVIDAVWLLYSCHRFNTIPDVTRGTSAYRVYVMMIFAISRKLNIGKNAHKY